MLLCSYRDWEMDRGGGKFRPSSSVSHQVKLLSISVLVSSKSISHFNDRKTGLIFKDYIKSSVLFGMSKTPPRHKDNVFIESLCFQKITMFCKLHLMYRWNNMRWRQRLVLLCQFLRQQHRDVNLFLLCCFLSVGFLWLKIILVVNIFQGYKSFPYLICTCYSRYSLQGFSYLYLFFSLRQPEWLDVCRARKFVQFDHGGGDNPAFFLTDRGLWVWDVSWLIGSGLTGSR